ncbi:MAG: protein-disulfide reductase DsbD domain-containing protein [Fimbriimonas sp.]
MCLVAQATGEHVKAELVSAVQLAQPGKPFLMSVILRTDPGWHVYWANPGDSGIPTTLTWTLPPGWSASEPMFGVPSRFTEKDLVTYGFEGSTMILTKITAPAEARVGPVTIRVKADWLACKDSCIPGGANLKKTVTLAQKDMNSSMWGDRLFAVEASVPKPVEGWKAEADIIEGGFVIKVTPPKPLEKTTFLPTFYPLDMGTIEHAWPQRIEERNGQIWIGLKRSQFLQKDPTMLRGVLQAPKGTKWDETNETILIEAPFKPK